MGDSRAGKGGLGGLGNLGNILGDLSKSREIGILADVTNSFQKILGQAGDATGASSVSSVDNAIANVRNLLPSKGAGLPDIGNLLGGKGNNLNLQNLLDNLPNAGDIKAEIEEKIEELKDRISNLRLK